MINYEDECVGCPIEIGCLGSSCPKKNVPHYFCDECGDEFYPSELYKYDGEELCKNCLVEKFDTLE